MKLINQPKVRILSTGEIKAVTEARWKNGALVRVSIDGEWFSTDEVQELTQRDLAFTDNSVSAEELNRINSKLQGGFHFGYFEGFYIRAVILLNEEGGAELSDSEHIESVLGKLEELGIKAESFFAKEVNAYYTMLARG